MKYSIVFIIIFVIKLTSGQIKPPEYHSAYFPSLMKASKYCLQSILPRGLHLRKKTAAHLHHSFYELGPVTIRNIVPSREPVVLLVENLNVIKEIEFLEWNPESCFVAILLNPYLSPESVLKEFWNRLRMFRVFVVSEAFPDTIITYNPFKGEIHESREVIPIDLKNFWGFKVNVVYFNRNASFATIINDKNQTLHFGVDVSLMRILEFGTNTTFILHKPEDGNRYGWVRDDGTYVGTLRDLSLHKAELTANGHFIKDYGNRRIQFSNHIYSDRLCAIVPKSAKMPHLLVIAKCFRPEIWLSILASYIIIIVLKYSNHKLHLKKHSSLSNIAISIFQQVFSAPSCSHLRFLSDRILHLSVLFFSFIIINIFQGHLITSLNVPFHYPEINTMEEIDRSGLIIKSGSNTKDMLTQDPKLEPLSHKVVDPGHNLYSKNQSAGVIRFQRESTIASKVRELVI
ncbi:uncharacterized protein LOC120349956 [Nilaparvata lugens]|uniref:uncharacterized protein LOC120349956 n=1 Tax=Nilaparvata lugens TaxID=108931 RepID=UPI00193DD734|nr:uncharacterized protein LOC120349956 [Nilaparvata lugens]